MAEEENWEGTRFVSSGMGEAKEKRHQDEFKL
jgi:hypothetical protein